MLRQRARRLSCVIGVIAAVVAVSAQTSPGGGKRLVAHRGASAYAPEHTLAAYRLAMEQGADYVEQDLAVTRDGVLICLHDDTLERTTNVEQLFPDRKPWLAVDFTVDEIKRLDAGSWFAPSFAGERIPTWEEAVALVGDKAGLYPELKSPPLYRARGIDMNAIFVASLRKLRLDGAPAERLIVQSFDDVVLRELTKVLPGLARTFLIEGRDGPRWLTPQALRDIATFATGIGPAKRLIDGRPELVQAVKKAGLTVTPYTFSSRGQPTRFSDVAAEMRYYLAELDVDALFTDNPDRFPH